MSKQRFDKQNTNFTMIANNVINDSRLSLKAIGVFTYMFSKPNDWNFTVKSMSKQMKDGTRSIMSAIDELKEFGYLEYIKHSDGSGDYHLYYEPKLQNPNLGNAKMAERNRINKIDIPNKKDCTKVESVKANASPQVRVLSEGSMEVAVYLYDKIKMEQPNFRQPNLDNWAKDIDKAIRIDSRTKEQLANAIDWIYSKDGEFWQSNIMSCSKLRLQYDQLEAKATANMKRSNR